MSLKSLHTPGALWLDITALSLLFTPMCFFSPPSCFIRPDLLLNCSTGPFFFSYQLFSRWWVFERVWFMVAWGPAPDSGLPLDTCEFPGFCSTSLCTVGGLSEASLPPALHYWYKHTLSPPTCAPSHLPPRSLHSQRSLAGTRRRKDTGLLR